MIRYCIPFQYTKKRMFNEAAMHAILSFCKAARLSFANREIVFNSKEEAICFKMAFHHNNIIIGNIKEHCSPSLGSDGRIEYE